MARSEDFRAGERALKAGAYDEAKKRFRADEEAKGTVSDTIAKLQAAEAKLAQGQVGAASELYEAVIDRNPSVAEAYAGLARVALLSGQLDAAKVHAMATVRLSPRLGLGWTLVGLVHESLNETDRILPALEKGVELSADSSLCQVNLGRYLASIGKHEPAVAALTAATRLAPSNPEPFIFLGMALRQAKQPAKALKAVEKATEVGPKSVDAWASLGDLHFEARNFAAARAALDKGLAACGDHPALLEKVLAATLLLDDPTGAVGYLERQLAVVPGHEQGWLNLAQLAMLAGDHQKAERAATTLLEKNPKRWEAHQALGNLYAAAPAVKKAEAAYRKAIDLAPKEWKPLLNLATLFLENEDGTRYAEALSLLTKAKSLAPKDEWKVPYNQALALVRLGQADRALEVVQALLKAAPPADPIVKPARVLEANLLERQE